MTAPTAAPTATGADTRTYWRILLAVVAPVAGFALCLANATAPGELGGSTTDQVTSIAAHRGAATAGLWIGLLFTLTLVPGAIAVLWVCRRRQPRFTAVAGTFVLLGFLSGMANPNTTMVALVGADRGIDPETLVSLSEAMNSSVFTGVALLPFLLAITVGRILLGVLLWRARVAPRWMAALLIAAVPVEFVNVTGNLQPALSWAMTGLGFASATVALLRTPDREFDLPPQ